ncbi:MAG TPA: methyltransferase [Sideroxyarcus sp.]|nr:methyltransferase [Sideroxyarcus sp.]
MQEWITFVIGTLLLAYISRASLRAARSHGFCRFLAWELMLLLFTRNLDSWHDAPAAWNQTLSGILMSLSLFLVLIGYLSLQQFGRQDDRRDDGAALLDFEKTTALVTHGIYRLIRHPMYDSLMAMAAALFFKQISWLNLALALLACALLVLAALIEERENTRYFGEPYREYMQQSKRFVPFLL